MGVGSVRLVFEKIAFEKASFQSPSKNSVTMFSISSLFAFICKVTSHFTSI